MEKTSSNVTSRAASTAHETVEIVDLATARIRVDPNAIAEGELSRPLNEPLDALERKIKAEGPLEPLFVWRSTDERFNGLLIDGLLRFEIYGRLGITRFPIVYKTFATIEEAVDWRLRQNLLRRNLNSWLRCVAVLPIYRRLSAMGKANQRRGGKGEGLPNSEKVDATATAAAIASVSKSIFSDFKNLYRGLSKAKDCLPPKNHPNTPPSANPPTM